MKTRTDIKARWTEEETLLLAKKEAEITTQRKIRYVNQELASIFKHRTLEAIKKARQKTDYKNAVRRFVDELIAGPSQPHPNEDSIAIQLDGHQPMARISTTAAAVPTTEQPPPQPGDDFLGFMLQQPRPRSSAYNRDRLLRIIEQASAVGKNGTMAALSSYLLDVLPTSERPPPPARNNTLPPPTNRRRQRRQEYATVQKNWSKHQGRCIKSILEGPNNSTLPPRNITEPYWRNIMEQECTASPGIANLEQQLDTTWDPITSEEVSRSRLPASTSPGLDGISARQLNAVPNDVLMRIFNLILWCGKIPSHIATAKTIFIPKKTSSTDPGDFRPITVPSVITRQLHGIISRRLTTSLSLDPRQRAFQPSDGCADNATLIDLLLRHHHQKHGSCYVVLLDVSKAFDSVSHPAIFETLRSYGLPEGLINYLAKCYETSSTTLIGEGWTSTRVHPKRGVKQGDPLSPVIFNIIIDRLLKTLPKEIGCYIGARKINALAFADDLTLFASTPQGLQTLIDTAQTFLELCGMTTNSSKCISISIKGQPKQKNTVVEERAFRVAGREIPHLKRTDEWLYLGIPFTADGKCKYTPHTELQPNLDSITKAPLKPQQRLHALRTVLIPKLYHKLTLGNVMIGSLNKTDRIIRAAVRRWLDLPKDVPTAFFHAPIDQGGVGIQSLRWNAPWLRKQRLNNIQWPCLEEVLTADTFIATELDKVERRLQIDGRLIRKKEDIDNHWTSKLHDSVDGYGLREAGQHKQAHRWIREPSRLLSGRDFVNCIKIRINALPSRSRTTRGRHEMDRTCRAGCSVPETTNHIVQQCHRTHSNRIDRHNSVAAFIKRSLRNKGYNTIEEPRLNTTVGIRKPDIVATLGRTTVVIDAQVVTDGRSLEEAHQRKAAYYNTSEMREQIRSRFGGEEPIFLTATLNWRGIWSGSSIQQLLALDVLRKTDTALISTRVAIGSIRSFRTFNNTTSVRRRQGIG